LQSRLVDGCVAGGTSQLLTVKTSEAKCVTQSCKGVEAGRSNQAALEVRNAANADAGAFGKHFLRQHCRESIALEEYAK
jgi:hypothetical protein